MTKIIRRDVNLAVVAGFRYLQGVLASACFGHTYETRDSPLVGVAVLFPTAQPQTSIWAAAVKLQCSICYEDELDRSECDGSQSAEVNLPITTINSGFISAPPFLVEW